MSAVIRRQNIRVVVEPTQPWMQRGTETEREDRLIAEAGQIVQAIKRHVDDIEGAVVEFDRVSLCSFCESVWEIMPAADATPEEPAGVPLCCNAAQIEWHAEQVPA